MKNKGKSANEGIALIVVLGFLSLLVIMGVAFAVSMRIERLVSRNYMELVKARHLAETAFTRVIAEEINDNLNDLVYPEWDALPLTSDGTGPDFLGEGLWVRGYIPGSVLAQAWEANQAAWIDLYEEPAGTNLMGQYSFLVVNNSGLLDANHVGAYQGQDVTRTYGTNVGEIAFNPAVQTNEVWSSNLNAFRNAFVKFESLPELFYLGRAAAHPGISANAWRDRLTAPAGRDFYNNLNTFQVYSRFPYGYADDELVAQTNVVYIGGDPGDWVEADIVAALDDVNEIPDVNAFVGAIFDYADSSYVPHGGNLERFHAKPIPMINEVVVSNEFRWTIEDDGDGGTVQELHHRATVIVEAWYPFPEDPDQPSFALHIEPPTQFRIMTDGETLHEYDDAPVLVGADASQTPMQPDEYEFFVRTNRYERSFFVNGADTPIWPPNGDDGDLLVENHLEAGIEVRFGDAAVDRVSAFPAGAFFVEGAPPELVPNGPWEDWISTARSANDPRINWSPAEHWVLATQTLGTTNENVRLAMQGLVSPAIDPAEVGRMFAPRRPFQTVGELSFLLYDEDKPWTTVRLLDHDEFPNPDNPSRVFDRLTVHTNEFFRQGLVNVNSENLDALSAVFWRARIDPYLDPDAPGIETNTIFQARDMAELVFDDVMNNGFYRNLSEITRLQRSAFEDILDLEAARDKFRLESVMRNSIGLLGTRHQLFTVLVAARVLEEGFNPAADDPEDFVVAEQRALALVWRDPFQTEDDTGTLGNRTIIRFFHWLTEVGD